MECPACTRALEEISVDGVIVDVCKNGCGGIWFDNYELKKLDEPHEIAGELLLEYQCHPGITLEPNKKLNCPHCENVIMMQHFFSVKRQVMIDVCAKCAGIWLNAGELGAIRSLFKTEAERMDAANQYFKELFEGKIAASLLESKQQLEHSRKIANIFRFICPSYYIPGKQDGGAF